jgi:hypothetical protein
MRLTKVEVKKILRAANLLATGKQFHACNALAFADGTRHFALLSENNLVEKFTEFYDKDCGYSWYHYDFSKIAIDMRIVLLLTFAEVGRRGVKL